MEEFIDRVDRRAPIHSLWRVFASSAITLEKTPPESPERERALGELSSRSKIIGEILNDIIGGGDGSELHRVRADAARYILGLPNLEQQIPQQ